MKNFEKDFKKSLEKFYFDIMRMNKLVGNDYKDYSFSPRYNNLVREEIENEDETVDSILKKNYEGFVDGVIDVLVVGYFLYKVENKNDNIELVSDSFKNLEVSEIATFIKELIIYCQKSVINDNIENILYKMEQISYTLGNHYNVDILGAFQEVMDSNFSKFPLVGDVDPDYEVEYIKNQKRKYTGVHYIVVEDIENGEKVKKYVFKNDKGKFLKPSCFREPKIHMYLSNDNSLISELYRYISK